MKRENTIALWETYINGNISDFRAKVKKMRKIDMLDMIETITGEGTPRHVIINAMRNAL